MLLFGKDDIVNYVLTDCEYKKVERYRTVLKMQLSKEKANNRLQVRISEIEKEYLRQEAAKRGLTVSELVKKAIDEYLKEV